MGRYNVLPEEFTPKFLDQLDGRTVVARTLRARLGEIMGDLGGEEQLSHAQRSLARRAVWLESWLETQEAAAAEGEQVDIGRQVQALNALIGLWRTLGLERRQKNAPSLQEYLKAKEQAS